VCVEIVRTAKQMEVIQAAILPPDGVREHVVLRVNA